MGANTKPPAAAQRAPSSQSSQSQLQLRALPAGKSINPRPALPAPTRKAPGGSDLEPSKTKKPRVGGQQDKDVVDENRKRCKKSAEEMDDAPSAAADDNSINCSMPKRGRKRKF